MELIDSKNLAYMRILADDQTGFMWLDKTKSHDYLLVLHLINRLKRQKNV